MLGAHAPKLRPVLAALLTGFALLGCDTGSATLPASTLPADSLSPAPSQSPAASAWPSISASPSPAASAPPAAQSPSGSPSVVPSVSAAPTRPPEGLSVDPQLVARHLDAMARIADENGGNRAAGTSGYEASAVYVSDQLAALGYDVQRDPVDFTYFKENSVTLALGDSTWSGGQWLHAMIYSASGQVDAPLDPVGSWAGGASVCSTDGWRSFARGHIAVLYGEGCAYRQIVLNAQQAGAAAVIAMYPHWQANETRRPTLLDPSGIDIPAIVTGAEPSSALVAAADGHTSAQLAVEMSESPARADDVLGTLTGSGDEVVMLGGHLDSVIDGPGINDNGSGVATLLALAESLAAQPQPERSVRFAFWTAEELGDLGSASYVDSLPGAELTRIAAYVNLDMVASPNPVRLVYDSATDAPGSDQITRDLLDALSNAGTPGLPIDLGASSDHAAFERAGVPTGGVFSGLSPVTPDQARVFGSQADVPADACYHLACDGRSNISLDSAQTLGNAVAAVLEALAYP